MKHLRSFYTLLALLIIVSVGISACSSNDAKEASMFSLPDFSSTNNIKPANQKPVSSLQDLNDALVNIAKKTNPAVVTIHIKEKVKVQRPQNPFGFFFGNPSQNGPPHTEQRRGLGSGVIVSKDGYILTNNHVVHNADHIRVTLNNNKDYVGKVVGTDPLTDLAVVKIDADDLPTIKMGYSDSLKVGSLVMAIGSPETLSHTVTFGIVSAKHRHINIIHEGKEPGFENYIQTDAAINPGNSGGALIDMNGELIGINAAIYSKTGMNGGIGFAVPIDLARRVMKQIIKNGKVVHARIGIQGKDVTSALAKGMNLKNSKGILINDVVNNSPASRAGLKQGDVIKTYNGKPVKKYLDFRTEIATSKPGEKVTLGIVRNGKKKKIHVTLGKLNLKSGKSSNNSQQGVRERLGFKVQKLTDRIRQALNIKNSQQGVVVTSVKQGSKASRNGLVKGDVITHVNKKKIKNMDNFNKAINQLRSKKHPVILLQAIDRNGQNQYIAYSL